MDLNTPLERWARRAPRTRWPLVLIALFLLWGLAGGIQLGLLFP